MLIQNGTFIAKGTFYKLSRDYTFTSPSTAASVVLGRNANGRLEWKGDGQTLGEIQEADSPLIQRENRCGTCPALPGQNRKGGKRE
jgi:hypothetical protein